MSSRITRVALQVAATAVIGAGIVLLIRRVAPRVRGYFTKAPASSATAESASSGGASVTPQAPGAPKADIVQQIRAKLKTRVLGRKKIIHVDSCDSTMNLADHEINSSEIPQENHAAIFLAEEQTKGIGRRSRTWISEKEENVYLTLCLFVDTTKDTLTTMKLMNFGAPLAVIRAAANQGVNCFCKWPNDVWIGHRKLSGCIVNQHYASSALLLGLGVNINQQFPSDSPAISLRDSLGRSVDRSQFIADFLYYFENIILDYSVEQLLEEYSDFHLLTNKVVHVHHVSREVDDERDYDAVVKGIHTDGTLTVKNNKTDEINHLSGEEVSISVL